MLKAFDLVVSLVTWKEVYSPNCEFLLLSSSTVCIEQNKNGLNDRNGI